VEDVFENFKQAYSIFTKIEYDALNPDVINFEADLKEFNRKLKDLDRRLAAILALAYDDCHSMESATKVAKNTATYLKFKENFK